MSYRAVGLRWSPQSFPAYLATQPRPSWAKAVTIHHCSSPSLAQRPNGFLAIHLENLASYYKNTKGWSSGPHLFTDEDDIFGLTPLSEKGVHAVSFNSNSIGIEMLGDYDEEDPKNGRGGQVTRTTASTARALLDWLGLKPSRQTLFFHRFDPRTTKTCPGTKVAHEWFLQMVLEATPGAVITPDPGELADAVVALVPWLSEKTGLPIADLAKRLRREGPLHYLGESWIEGAYYDAAAGATMAPIAEAREVLALLTAKPVETAAVAIVPTMAERLGIRYEQAAKCISFDGINFAWKGTPIPGAFYDRARQATMAPAHEVAKLS